MLTDYSVEICAFLAGKVAKCHHAVNVYQNFTCLEHREAIFLVSEWHVITLHPVLWRLKWLRDISVDSNKQHLQSTSHHAQVGRRVNHTCTTCWLLLRHILADTLYKIQLYTNHKHHHLFFVFFKYLHINTMYKKFTKQNRFLKRSPSSLFFSLFRKID